MMERWVYEILADPISKQPADAETIGSAGGVIDARRFLKNTIGYGLWREGQQVYESWDQRTVEDYKREIDGVAPVYDHIRMSGRVLDVGGGAGTVRHFLPPATQFVSIDPFLNYRSGLDEAKLAAYPCLRQPLNFIAACAEFLPFQSSSFDWVHMRSMLDHVQSPDLAMMEAHRVLKPDGRLVIGLYVDGGKTGKRPLDRQLKEIARTILTSVGVTKYKDHHTFHPTFVSLCKIITDNGFVINDVYWQPQWKDQVCYVTSGKPQMANARAAAAQASIRPVKIQSGRSTVPLGAPE